jgi:hypothetical protein
VARVARVFDIPKQKIYTKGPQNLPFDHNIGRPNAHKIYLMVFIIYLIATKYSI